VKTALAANDFTMTGYSFTGWNTDPEGTGEPYADGQEITLQGDLALYAQWAPVKYSVHFEKNASDAAGAMDDQELTYDVRQDLTGNAFGRTSYTFAGWNTMSDGSGTAYRDRQQVVNLAAQDGVTVTLYAVWAWDPPVVVMTVTFDVQGHGDAPDDAEVAPGEKVTEPAAPVAEGYTFGGWYREPYCENRWDFDKDTVTSDITLYARWL
jgi:uncharacterized repeat protein (TIGR02543 family)